MAATNNNNAGRTPKPILEFRAGKMLIRGTVITPDTRKGLVQIVTEEDQPELVHFKWIDRSNKQVETDLVLIPDPSCSFKRIKQCTTGRVFLLEWKTTHLQMFFWMQEPSTDRDEEIVTRINSLINQPTFSTSTSTIPSSPLPSHHRPSTSSSSTPSTSSATPTPTSTSTQQPTSSSATTAAAGASSSRQSNTGITGDLLQNLLSGLGVEGQQGGSGSEEQAEQGLEGIMDSGRLEEILRDPEVSRRLLEFLPEGRRTPQEVAELIRSPQFAQALRTFSGAVQSGGLGGLMPHFGLPTSSGNSVSALFNALAQQSAPSSTSTSSSSSTATPATTSTNTSETTATGTAPAATSTESGTGDKMDVDEDMPPLIPEKKDGDQEKKP